MNISHRSGRSASLCFIAALTLCTLGAACGPETLVPGAPEQAPGLVREALGEGPAFLIKDIHTQTPANLGSTPRTFATVNGVLYFAATDSTSGEELWRSDGTAAGTVLVSDLCSGPCSSNPRSLTAMNGVLYFFAHDSSGTQNLWRSDGTAAGTRQLKAINNNNFGPKLTPINGTLYFYVYDPTTGEELWTGDGTAAGTKLLKDLYPGTGNSFPQSFVELNGAVFFSATSAAGNELWKSDGTPDGTVLFKELLPGTGSGAPTELVVHNGVLYFIASDVSGNRGLFRSDGTPAGTLKLREFGSGKVGGLVVFSGLLHFWATDATYGHELWKSDGTPAGTVLAVDVRPGSTGSSASFLRVAGNNLFFTGSDGSGHALWKTDGTPEGTVRLLSAPSSMDNLTAVGSSLYFTGLETSTAFTAELWVSDGTVAGSRMVKDINPGTSAGAFSTTVGMVHFGALNDVLYFGANNGSLGSELWRSDGTAAGTTLVRDILAPTSDASPANLILGSDGKLYFTADDGLVGAELWRSDGTTAGTSRYWDVCSGTCSPSLSAFTVHGQNLFYVNTSGSNARLMYSPTAPGSSGALYADTSLNVTSPRMASFKNWLYFRANDSAYGDTLRMTTGSHTTRASDTSGRGLMRPDHLVVSNGMLFFTADDGSGLGTELYKVEGTSVTPSAVRVKDLWPGVNGSSPNNLTDVNGTLFFRAQDADGAYMQLWKSDGTSAGTVKVATLPPGNNGTLAYFNNVSGTLFFVVTDYTAQTSSLWKSDGTGPGTVKVKELPPRASLSSSYFASMGGALYFGVRDDANGFELWKSDGTPEGTGVLVDLRPGPNGGFAQLSYNNGALVSNLLPLAEGVLLFSASDGENGMELWMTDGTAAGTFRLTDLAPGSASSTPTTLVRAGALVYFAANDGARGRELWAVRVADLLVDRTPPTVTCPANVGAEATSATGASVTYPAATATDNRTASPSITYSRASGTVFPLGMTSVTATARDLNGNTATCAFTVTVRDTTAPVLVCRPDVTAWTTTEEGAWVNYMPAMAKDAVSRTTVSYDLPSGGLFPLGQSAVTATATDAVGNTASCDFQVDVILDVEPPVLTCPSEVTWQATSCEGAEPSSLPVSATDALSPVSVTYGEQLDVLLMPVGDRVLTATAVDAAGNSARCEVLVHVLAPAGCEPGLSD